MCLSSESELSSDTSNKDISRTSESGLYQELCDQTETREKLSNKDSASSSQQEAASTAPLEDQRLDEKSDIELPSRSLHDYGEMQMSFDIQVSKEGEQLQTIPYTNSSRPQTPTYAFHPVDNSNSEEGSFPLRQVKFESQISGEDLNPDKHKVESVASSDDELSIGAPNEKVRATSSVSEFVQGRFTISASSDRPYTPLSETLDNARPLLPSQAPLDVTLSDMTTAAVMGSVPSLTPSSSMESLNSVGSQPGAMISHTSSSSPQTTPLEGQGSNSPSAACNKDPVRKNSGQSDLLNDGARHLLAKQEGEQQRKTAQKTKSLHSQSDFEQRLHILLDLSTEEEEELRKLTTRHRKEKEELEKRHEKEIMQFKKKTEMKKQRQHQQRTQQQQQQLKDAFQAQMKKERQQQQQHQQQQPPLRHKSSTEEGPEYNDHSKINGCSAEMSAAAANANVPKKTFSGIDKEIEQLAQFESKTKKKPTSSAVAGQATGGKVEPKLSLNQIKVNQLQREVPPIQTASTPGPPRTGSQGVPQATVSQQPIAAFPSTFSNLQAPPQGAQVPVTSYTGAVINGPWPNGPDNVQWAANMDEHQWHPVGESQPSWPVAVNANSNASGQYVVRIPQSFAPAANVVGQQFVVQSAPHQQMPHR